MIKKINKILDFLDELYPNAKIELAYHYDYELVIAVMLSAQTTDKKVNIVTPILFSKYKNLDELCKANIDDIEKILKPLGMSKVKARYVIEISKKITTDFNYVVPEERELLMSLPGVGNKTANVIRAELFKIPEIPVDTHVARIAVRLGLAKKSDSPIVIEKKLKKIILPERWIKTHHQLIHFGRYFCRAKNPLCKDCKIKDICLFYKKSI
jgi:endonuclease-3